MWEYALLTNLELHTKMCLVSQNNNSEQMLVRGSVWHADYQWWIMTMGSLIKIVNNCIKCRTQYEKAHHLKVLDLILRVNFSTTTLYFCMCECYFCSTVHSPTYPYPWQTYIGHTKYYTDNSILYSHARWKYNQMLMFNIQENFKERNKYFSC